MSSESIPCAPGSRTRGEVSAVRSAQVSRRANTLADRLEQGASALATLAGALTDAEWQIRIPKDGRKIGVVVHHVATMYPLEIQLAQSLPAARR